MRFGISFTRKKVVGCSWVYTVKFNRDDSLAHLKARLVAKKYPQNIVLTTKKPCLL